MVSALIILLFLSISCAAGYLPLRAFARPLRLDTRLALLPLTGAALAAVTLQWVHLIFPISRPLALLAGLAPAAAGLALFVRDRRKLSWSRTVGLALGVAVVGLLIPLLPFLKLGYPTSLGIANNDAIFYVASDQLIDEATYNVQAPSSILIQASAGIRRYGINYLAAPVRAITGLRSWEIIHIAGGFAVFLSMCASFLLARALGARHVFAIFAGLLVGAGHWVYRLYLDAFLAYLFGLAFLIAILWSIVFPWPGAVTARSRLAISTLMVAGLSVFYFDLLPVAFILAAAVTLLLWRFDADPLSKLASFPLAAVLTAPTMYKAVQHFLVLTDSQGVGEYFNFDDVPRTLYHFSGMLDIYGYLAPQAGTGVLHLVGAIAGLLLLAWTLAKLPTDRRNLLFTAGAILPLLALFTYFLYQGAGRQYHAHRVLVTVFALTPAVLSAVVSRASKSSSRSLRIGIQALAGVLFATSLQPLVSLLGRIPGKAIVVTPAEKQIGAEWLSPLPSNAAVFIDLHRDTHIFYPHYLYWEAAHALRDERRVRLSAVNFSYLPAPAGLDLSRVTHILRRKNELALVEGSFLQAASNERYELLRVPPGGVLHHPLDNFHGVEFSPGVWARWMKQDGATRICAPEATRIVARGVAVANPAIGALTITASLNGTPAGTLHATGPIEMPFHVPAGCSTIVWHSSEEPRKPGIGDDQREFTVQFQNLVFQPQTK